MSKTALISGATSGIGEAAARAFAAAGWRVIATGRRTERLKALVAALGADKAYPAVFDVCDETARDKALAALPEAFRGVDLLINNAGLMPLSALDDLKVDEWDRMIDVNIKGVLYGIAAALPVFRKQQCGHFINVSSVAGHRVSPNSAVYSATKFAVRALSEGLRQEAGNKIRVTIISPGAVESELAATISDPTLKRKINDYRKMAIPADAIAQAMAFAIAQPAHVDINEILVRPTSQPN